jgi:hypothetical protein
LHLPFPQLSCLQHHFHNSLLIPPMKMNN